MVAPGQDFRYGASRQGSGLLVGFENDVDAYTGAQLRYSWYGHNIKDQDRCSNNCDPVGVLSQIFT